MNITNKVLDMVNMFLDLLKLSNIALLLGFILSIALIWAGISGYIKANNTKSWPSTSGIVTISYATQEGYESGGESYIHYIAKLSYDYKLGERTHFGDESGLKEHTFETMEEAQNVTEKYLEGEIIRIYYNPDEPGDSVLEPGIVRSSAGTLIGVGLFFLIIVAAFTCMVIQEGRKR